MRQDDFERPVLAQLGWEYALRSDSNWHNRSSRSSSLLLRLALPWLSSVPYRDLALPPRETVIGNRTASAEFSLRQTAPRLFIEKFAPLLFLAPSIFWPRLPTCLDLIVLRHGLPPWHDCLRVSCLCPDGQERTLTEELQKLAEQLKKRNNPKAKSHRVTRGELVDEVFKRGAPSLRTALRDEIDKLAKAQVEPQKVTAKPSS